MPKLNLVEYSTISREKPRNQRHKMIAVKNICGAIISSCLREKRFHIDLLRSNDDDEENKNYERPKK